MAMVKFLKISNFTCVTEKEIEPGKINIMRGPKGVGKTTVIEALQKGVENKNIRTEIIKHGEEEASIFIECNDGLEIDRKIRNGKSDYLKLRNTQTNEGIPSTEKFLRELVSGNIFRPLDWINKSVKEQTASLLSMLVIGWSEEDIINWFGDLADNIDYTQHILLILKSIEQKYYTDREEVNRSIKELKARIKSILFDLPGEYNGEEWKLTNVQEAYRKVTEAQEINKWIAEAKSLQENFNSKVETFNANADADISRVTIKYKNEREDIDDFIDLSRARIEKAKNFINTANEKVEIELSKLDNELESRYQELLQEYACKKDAKKREIFVEVENKKEIIAIQNNKISAKDNEILGLAAREEAEKKIIEEKAKNDIEKEELKIGKASQYLNDHEEIDILPLQNEAEHIQEMVSYLREWDKITEIRDYQLAPKERVSADLTAKIEKARTLPSELLKTAKMPIDGVSVDEEGRIRINNTLIDGLSDGEKLELAMKVAKAQCGSLRVICMDKWESLDLDSQNNLLEEMKGDGYQYFITEVTKTESGEMEIEKIGEVS